MKINNGLLFLVITIMLGIEQTFSQEYQQSFDIRIPFAPDFVVIGGKPTVYYELHLTNFSSDSIDLKRLEIVDTPDSIVVVSIGKDDLKKRYARIGVPRKNNESILPPGASGVIYLELTLQNNKPNVQLTHRLEFEMMHRNGRQLRSAQSALTPLAKKPQLVLGPPLSGGPWAAVYEPSWERGHRRVIHVVNGKARIPGRFAIDFIKLDSQGRYAHDDNNVVKNWYGYGIDVFAVADGIVASTRDDFSESPTLSEHPKYPSDKTTGNYISIDIGNNHIVFYEHLKPGSINVKPGQRVKKGDILASVGFTGQSTGPHLHFHIANANSPLGAEGIPFAFESFTILGSYTDFENFGKTPWVPLKDSDQLIISGERPAPNSVIKF